MEWKKLIADLVSRGWTQAQIARELNKPQSWVSDIARDRYQDLRWSDGEALRRLHKKVISRAARRKQEADHA